MKTEIKKIVLAAHESGQSRNQIMTTLVRDHDMDLDQANKAIKESGAQFRRKKGNTWKDICLEEFKANKDLTKAEMKEAITGSIKEGAEDYYVNGWYDLFKAFANI